MKRKGFIVSIVLVFLFLCASIPVQAGDDIVQNVLDGCKKERDTYCKDVSLGEGRLLACLYAHEDKLSGRCDYALYDAAAQLEHYIAALSYAASECRNDLEKLCSDVPEGEGRLVDCLKKNDAKVSNRCKQAQKDIWVK
jgi:hypothetical protein